MPGLHALSTTARPQRHRDSARLKILFGDNYRGLLADWLVSRTKCVPRIPKITYPFVEKLFLPLKRSLTIRICTVESGHLDLSRNLHLTLGSEKTWHNPPF